MLSQPTPYPYVGSYALYEDPDLPVASETELVRILAKREGWAMVSFPLRLGAGGNKTVALSDLKDGTPLTREELREFHDLDRSLRGRSMRTPKQKREGKRRDALKRRIVCAPILDKLLRQAAQRSAA